MTELPPSIKGLAGLTGLDLSRNELSELPREIRELSSLRVLKLSSNSFTEAPWHLFPRTLQVLALAGNQLTQVPAEVGEFAEMIELTLTNNRLNHLPPEVSRLHKLEVLRLALNQLIKLPVELGTLYRLRVLEASENPLRELRAAERSGRLIEYLRALATKTTTVNEVKLVLVGEGAAGKSSLLAALCGEPHDPDRSPTHGLEVKRFHVAGATPSETFTVRAWDFGGQRQYRPTHQLFFSSEAIYLLVWRPRLGWKANQVEYWAEQVRQRAGDDVPIFLVATHADIDSVPPDVDEGRLRDQFAISQIFSVGSPTHVGIADLESGLLRAAHASGAWGRQLPESWLSARDRVVASERPHISFDKFIDICIAAANLSEEECDGLARIGNTLGWWIYYAGRPNLNDLVILRGDWLSTAIALVADESIRRRWKGLVPISALAQIWSEGRTGSPRYPSYLHQHFVSLMETYDIAYRPAHSPNRPAVLVVPQLLAETRPSLAEVWIEGSEDYEESRYCEFVLAGTRRRTAPDSLMARFIARQHTMSLGVEDISRAVHWRNGAVLQESTTTVGGGHQHGTRALVEYVDDGVLITTRSKFPSGLVGELVRSFVALISDYWPGVAVVAYLACPRCNDPRAFEESALHDRMALGITAAECARCFAKPSIDRILVPGKGGGQVLEVAVREELERMRNLLDGLSTAQADSNALLKRVEATVETFGSQLRRDLRSILKAVGDEVLNGPRLFTMVPVEASLARPGLTHVRAKVTLYCERSYLPVWKLEGSPGYGVFEVDVPKRWWTAARPWLRRTGALLSVFAPISASIWKLGVDDSTWAGIDEPIELAKELSAAAATGLKAIAGSTDEANVVADAQPTRAEGAALREFHQILRNHDIGFADLRLVRDDNGFLWVHRSFVSEYL